MLGALLQYLRNYVFPSRCQGIAGDPSVGDVSNSILSHFARQFVLALNRNMSKYLTVGDYSNASPEKEVGESDKFYGSGFECDRNIFEGRRLRLSLPSVIARRARELVIEWSEEEIEDNGYTPMHVAASNGDLATLRTLIETNKNECLRRDKHGGTPLHAAARRGMVEAMKVILEACPDAVKVLTVARNNCLHTAVLYNQVGAVGFLVEWLKRNRDYAHLINGKDSDGKTPLHLAVSAKQIKILEVLLTCKVVDVNAMSSGGFTALDILDVLPRDRIFDVEIGRILGQAGALRARGLANRDTNQHAALRYKRKIFIARHVVVLLMATLVLITGYQAAFPILNGTLKEDYFRNPTLDGTLQRNKQESFIMFNSIWFVGSLAVVIFLLRKFPFKPWSQISVSMLFGSYMCCIFSMSPGEAWNLLLLAIPLLLLAAAGKLFGLGRKSARI
ncbi:unnamed protein product [Ilex paraguariensis]|uniref:PGG domain-containing protein n=1 Tax=Ilex paraguariensis TaxID=185542 RepID=A0ABC8V569_9AQUA